MITRLQDKIAAAHLTHPVGLSFSEYDSGCEGDISGGVAQAEMLGLFGRYGVYAATAWLNARVAASDYAGVAFDVFRNYDGAGATVGDLAVKASSSDGLDVSVYAFAHQGDAGKLELVVLNKSGVPVPVHLAVTTAATFSHATLFHLVKAATVAVTPVSGTAPPVTCAAGSCALDLTLEPVSATTVVLR
jgi:hypothetical protein